MAYLKVSVVDEDNQPMGGEEVTILVVDYCWFPPQTCHTDNDGLAYFDFVETGVSAGVYISGRLALEGIELGDDASITVTV